MSISELYYDALDELDINKKEILQNTKEAFEKLEMQNIHEYFYVYCYLLWNGYFSKEKSYEYSDTGIETYTDFNIDDEYSLFTGKGVCRHNAIFLKEVLNTLNIYAHKINIRLEERNIKSLMGIERKIGEHSNYSDNNGENHAVVFTKDNNGIYIMDPTILCELEIIKDRQLISYCGQYNVEKEIFRKNLPGIYKTILLPRNNSLSREFLISYYKKAKEKCLKNQKLFDNLYNENKNNYKKISKTLEYFKY